jgi:hypothetical protein
MNMGLKKIILQSNEVLAQLKAMDGHATRNVFKRKQDFIDGRLGITIIGFNSLNSPSSIEVDCFNLALKLAIPPSSSIGPLERLMTKQKMLRFQSRNLITMAFCYWL